ncbi:MAG TPA: hypothetical protein VMT17_04160, partial [Anaeromyxobacteraceae bacterium]|nr:hypothetical protein [Anaeromyxobacteraceae bacterium]
ISLAREDGADKDVLRRGTHQPPKDVMELYTNVEWSKLCAEVAKLRILLIDSKQDGPSGGIAPMPSSAEFGAGLGAVKTKTQHSQGLKWWRRRESKSTRGEHLTWRRHSPILAKPLVGQPFPPISLST